MATVLYRSTGGSVSLPDFVLNHRADGGHLVVDPPRSVWERSELSSEELGRWACLVAHTGAAMLEALPQLSGGCLNYWEASNWSLHDDADPRGRKSPQAHRRVHEHVFGRSPTSTSPFWAWGEAPRWPSFAERRSWAASFERLTATECDAVVRRLERRSRGHGA